MISNIDKTESERLNQKLRDIVTGKYQSPAKQRNNFFSTHLDSVGGEHSQSADISVISSAQQKFNATGVLPGAEKILTMTNKFAQDQAKGQENIEKKNAYYAEKYKDTPKTYEGYMKHAQYVSSDERKWLEKQAEQYATAEDYKKEADKAKADYNYYKNLDVKNIEKTIDALAIQKQAGFLDSRAKIEKRMNEAQDSERIAESKMKEKVYAEKYKDTPKTYEGYMKHAPYVSKDEREWLEKQAEQYATAEDYKKEADKASADYNYLNSIKADVQGNGGVASNKLEDLISEANTNYNKYKSSARKKEYEEKAERLKEILDNDVNTKTAVELYYDYQKEKEKGEWKVSDFKYTPEQARNIIRNFKALADKGYDPDALYTYYDRVKREEASAENLQKIQQDAMNNPVGASLWSVGDNVVGSIGDAVNYIGAGIAEDVTGEYQWIDTNDTAAARVNTVRGTVSDMIEGGMDNETAGKIASFLYQTGMSMADFAATVPLNLVPGVGTGLQMALLSTEAGTAQAKETYDNTGNAANALRTGIMAGIAEAFFEKFSIEKLKAFKSVAPDSVKSILKNAGKQMLTEASEEALTTIANTLTDSIINGDMSAIALEYQGYIDEGYSEEEATRKCAESFAKQVKLDAAGGAVSGGVLGGVVSAVSYAQGKKKSAQELGQEVMSSEEFDINVLLEQAKNSSNEKAENIAKSIEKKMSKNENYKVDSVDVGNLVKLLETENISGAVSENTDENKGENTGTEKKAAANTESNETISKEKIEEHSKYKFGSNHKNGLNATDRKGNKVVIVGVESSSRAYGEADNKVRVIADDGRVYNTDSLTFNLPEYNILMNAAKNFDTNGAGTLVQEYGDYVNFKGEEGNVSNYISAYSELYEAGKMGGSYKRVANHKYYAKYIDELGPQRAIQAVKAGNMDSDMFFSNEDKLVRIDRSGDVRANVMVEESAEGVVNLDDGTRLALEKLSEMTGKDIILTADMDENGRIDRRDGKIYIRATLNGNYIMPVAMHESMHSIRKESPKDYALIRNFVVDYLFAKGNDVNKMIDRVESLYKDKVSTREDCLEEIVCNSIMAIAGDESAMKKALQVAKAEKSILDKLANAIKNLAGKIKNFILTHTTNEAAKTFVKDVEALDKLAEMFSNAADNIKAKSEEVITNGQKNNTAEGVEDKKYSVETTQNNIMQDDFENKVDQIENNTYNSNDVVIMGRTPKVLQDIGFNSLPVAMTKNHIYSVAVSEARAKNEGRYKQNTNYHDLGFNTVKQIYNKISDPLMVIAHPDFTNKESRDSTHKVIALVDLSVNNKQVIAPILVDYESIYSKKRMDVNLVATYFNKNNINDLIKEAIALENNNQVGFYYLDKKRTQSIIKRTGYQLPRRLNNLSSNIIIRKIDSNVNKKIKKITQSQQFVRWFGDWQNKPKTASKVVDGNGEPLVVYHQTGNDFTVFDTKHTGAGEFDSEMPTGIFMKPTSDNIGVSGNKQMALYANIRNPFIANSRKELVDFYIKNIDGYSDAKNEVKRIDSEYKQKFQDEMKRENQEYQKLWVARKNGEISEEEYQKAVSRDALDDLLEEWHNKVNEASKKAKSLIDDYFRSSNYDGVIVNNDVGSFGRSTKTYIAFENTQVKSATDNIGTFDGKNPDIRYAIDDTLNDWLDDLPEGIDYEKVVEKNPVVAVAKIYNSAAKTAESGLRQSQNVRLEEKDYLRIAGKIMDKYGIKGKYNPNYKQELAEQLTGFIEHIGEKGSNFTDVFEELVNDCKGGILLSGEYDTTLMKDEREFVLDLIHDKTLFIRPRDIQQIEEDYGSVAKYRKKMFGKTNVAIKTKESGRGYYIEDVIALVEEYYPYLLDENADGDMGYLWLENLVNNVLKPKYKNPYFDGENSFYETPETAAVQMAFDCTTEIINQKTSRFKADKRADKKLIRKLETSQKEAVKLATELAATKNKQYRQELKEAKERNTELWKTNSELRQQKNEEHRKRVEHARQMFRKNLKEKQKTREQRNKNAELRKQNEAYRAIVASNYRTIREEYNEGRNKTLYIQKLGRMCDRLTKRLDGKARNNEYIPDSLKGPIVDVLRCFTAKNAKGDTPAVFGEWNRIKEVGDRVADLEREYAKLNSGKNPKLDNQPASFFDITSIHYKADVMERLSELSQKLKGHNIYTLTSDELYAIYDTMQELEESLKDAVQIIVDGKKQNFMALANTAIEEVKNNKSITDYSNMRNVVAAPFKQLGKSYITTHLDPVRYGRMLSNYNDDSVIYKMFSDLHKGENHAIALQHEAISRIKDVTIKYSDEVKKIQNEDVKEFNFIDIETKRRVPITQGVLLAIYLTDRQKSGHIHLLGGTDVSYGNKAKHFTVLPNFELDNMKLKRTAKEHPNKVRFTASDLQNIESYVEKNKVLMELASAISEVYNQTLKQEINEVSMAKYGMKIATVKNYYPLQVYGDAGKYEKVLETESYDTRLKSRGFTKKREWSSTPIVIEDALRKYVKQVREVSEYCGMVIPIENFKKVYNYSDGTQTLHSTIKDRYGVTAEHYIDKLIGDLQQRADTIDNTFLDTIQSNYMGMKIMFNMGSMIKQLSAFPLANRYFGGKNVSLAALNLFRNKVDFDLYNKYTSYLWYRKEGNGTVVGELSREMSLVKKWQDTFDFVGKMDNRVVASLLYAAELHVEQTTDLKKGTDAFYREVARQFEKCIDETQPNNMVTSKPQYLRNKNLRRLSLNAFRSQNMAIGNTIFDSFFEMKARMADDKINSTAESKAAKKAAVLKFVSCCSGAISANLLLGALSVLSSVILYHHWDDVCDDEGNISGQKIALNYLDEVLNGIYGSFAMGDYLYSAVSSAIDIGKTYYGLQVMSVDSINDMVNDVISGKALDALKTLLDCLGIPGTNIARFGSSIYAYYNDVAKGSGRIITDSKGNVVTDYLHYYIVEDKKDGNSSRAEYYESMWKEILMDKGKTESEATDYIKSKIVTALSADDDIEEAGVAKANGNLADYEKYRQKVIDCGFDSKDVQKAIDRFIKSEAKLVSEIEGEDERKQELMDNGFNENGTEYVLGKIETSQEYDDESKSTSAFDETSGEDELVMYSYSDLFDALINGDTENYDIIEKYMIEKGGKTKQEIESAMRSASRTDKVWAEYIEASTSNDRERTKELVEQLTRIYGSWSKAKSALTKYRQKNNK